MKKINLKKKLHFIPLIFLASGTAWALGEIGTAIVNDPCAFTSVLGVESEGGGSTNVVNEKGTAAGISQVTLASMGGIGAVNCTASKCPVRADAFGKAGVQNRDKYGTINSSYFGDLGINNWNDYLSGPHAREAQMLVAKGYFSSTVGSLEKSGTLQKYSGNSNNAAGINMNAGAMLQCAQAGSGLCPYILSGGSSGSRGTVTDQQIQEATNAMKKASNSYTPGGNCTQLPSGGNVDPSKAPQQNIGESGGLYCDPEILSAIQTLGAQEVDARMALAMDPRTGFTTLNGRGVSEAAGLNGVNIGGVGNSNGANGSTTGQGGSFFSMSCVDKMLNSGVSGISNIFNPPSWQEIQKRILEAAQNLVCSEANQLYQIVTQPLSQALYKSVNVGGFSPGMASIMSRVGLPTSIGIGGRVAVVPGPEGKLIPLEDRFNLIMNGSSYGSQNSYGAIQNGDNSGSVQLPSKLFGR